MYTCIYVYSYGHHLAAQVIGKKERHSLPMFELGYKSRRRASEVDKITFKFSFAVPCTIIALPCQSVSRLVEFCSNCCSCYMYFSKLLNGFFKIDTWISLSCYMDLSKLLHGFVKVVSWICQSCFIFFRPLLNKTKLKFDHDFKVSWSFCFEQKALNVSKYSVCCAFGNVSLKFARLHSCDYFVSVSPVF